jgi:hypothetical protein
LEFISHELPQLAKPSLWTCGIWLNQDGQIEMLLHQEGKYQRELVSDTSLLTRLSSLRQMKKKIEWLTSDEDPIKGVKRNILQLDLTQELERNLLVLGFKSPYSEFNDLLLIQFEKGINQFGLTSKNRNLNADDRSIIASLLQQSVESIYQMQLRNKAIFSPLAQMKSHLQSEILVMQNELDHKERTLSRGLEEYADHLLAKMSEELRVEIKLTARAFDKIGKFEGKFADLESSLKQSIGIAVNSNLHLSHELIIDESDLFLSLAVPAESAAKNTISDTPSVGRLTKTHQLLDKYEESARQAKRNGEAIIGRIIGSYCNPPISNAAITDSLKNHAERIWELMKKYPDKWPLIRGNFRSVINLIERLQEVKALAQDAS